MKYIIVLAAMITARLLYREARRRGGRRPAPVDPGFRLRLGVPRCKQCGHVVNLARRFCPACRNRLRLQFPIEQVLLAILLLILAFALVSSLRNSGGRI